jgi:hypothetical protein
MSRKKIKKLQGKVQKIIKPIHPSEPEKAEIEIDEADHLYREIRVDNEVTDETGKKDRLKPQEKVDVVIEADSDAPHDPNDS